MSHVEIFVGALTAAGMTHVENRRLDGHAFTFAVFSDVPIECGPHRGRTIERMAIPIPDDPMLPPPGIHTKPHIGTVGQKSVHASPLGPEWAYWSRPVHGYLPAQGVPRVLSHLQSIFRDA